MPTFVSRMGKWYAGKEEIGLTNKGKDPIQWEGKTVNPGQPFIYRGPDREAVKVLNEANQESLGMDFRRDPEFLQAVRNMGFQSGEQGVADYLDMIGFDVEEHEKRFDEQISVVRRHELPEKVKEIKVIGGGKDTAGVKENDCIGGFGDQKVRPAKEL